jgi:hypothetical protein
MSDEPVSNSISTAKLQGFIDEAKGYLDELDTLRANYMNACKGPKEGLAGVRDAAKDAGVARKVFNEIIKEIEDERKKEARIAKLDEDLRDQLDNYRLKLGMLADTPLGEAAMDEAEKDLRPDFLRAKVSDAA